MKKLLLVFSLIISAQFIKAQSNLTLVINDKVEQGYFKQDNYSWNVQGLQSQSDADNFLAKVKTDTNIKQATIVSAGNGEYTLAFSMNKVYNRAWLERMFMSKGVKYAMVNGEKKTLPTKSEKAVGK